ncbi:hypothetical protein TNCV_4804351 [Trichonephila clavipes]|nr:hypothetical protein TNCV_4804351 [Trichonephila clavipes]
MIEDTSETLLATERTIDGLSEGEYSSSQRSRLVEQTYRPTPRSEQYGSCSVLAAVDHGRDIYLPPRRTPGDIERNHLQMTVRRCFNADVQRMRIWRQLGHQSHPVFVVVVERRMAITQVSQGDLTDRMLRRVSMPEVDFLPTDLLLLRDISS